MYQSLNRKELVDAISASTAVSKADVEKVIVAFLGTVKTEVLDNGKSISLKSFGVFKQKVTAARKGRNPSNGETIEIAPGKSVSFSASASLREKTN